MKKTLLLALLSILYFQNAQAQDKEEGTRYIKGWSLSVLTDVGILQEYALGKVTEDYDINYDPIYDTTYAQHQRAKVISIATVGFNNHYILKKINEDQSLSLNVFPTLGFSVMLSKGLGEVLMEKIFNLTVPVFLNYNIGNVATFDTKKEKGFTVGVGGEFVIPGLIPISESADQDAWLFEEGVGRDDFPTKPYLQPSVNLGYRYFNKNEAACEFNLRYSFRTMDNYDKYNLAPAGNEKTLTQWFKLSYIRYIGY